MKLPGIEDDTSADSAELVALRAEDYESWLGGEGEATRGWLSESRFKAQTGAWSWLPRDGARPRALAIVADEPLQALAGLPFTLPEGAYRLRADWEGTALEQAVLGWGLGAYRFERYKAPPRAPARLLMPDGCDVAWIEAQLAAVQLVRDLINTPAGDMLPGELEAAARELAEAFGAEFTSTSGAALLREFPTIHAVGRASASPPRLLEMTWGDPAHPRLTLVGKGVCFDSGGLNIKPASGMRQMKKDMGGAAHVLGLARLIMTQRLPVRLSVLVPAVENAIDGNAFRPGDIIRTRKGLTVEVDNTDAEGRLILCDALALASERESGLIMDFATLTGAARSALGTDLPAMFCNDDAIAEALLDASARVADPLWRLPLYRPYRKMLDCAAADLANGASSPYAGAIVAALFLERFVGEGIPWVHLDLMAWNTTTQPGRPEGGEAMGLRASYAFLRRRYGTHQETA